MVFFDLFKSKNTEPETPRMAIIEDEPTLRELLADMIESKSRHIVIKEESMNEAIQRIMNEGCDFVLSDYYLTDGNGADLFSCLKIRGWKGTFWLCSRDGAKEFALSLGVDRFYDKEDLLTLAHDLLEYAQTDSGDLPQVDPKAS